MKRISIKLVCFLFLLTAVTGIKTTYADQIEYESQTEVQTQIEPETSVEESTTAEPEQQTQPVIVTVEKVKKLKAKTTVKKAVLSWSRSDATGYEIYQRKSGKWTKIADNLYNTYTVTGLKKAKTYKFKVRAYKVFEDTKIYGDYSDILSVATKFTSAKVKKYKKKSAYSTYKGWKDYFDAQDGIPSKIKYKKGVNISWKKIKGAKRYEIQVYRYSPVREKWVVIQTKTVKKNQFVLTNVTGKETYKFKIRAIKTVGKKKYYSSYSKSFKIKPKMSYSVIKTDKNYNPITKAKYDRFEAEKAFVKQNDYRRKAGVQELVWNEELYEIAKLRAKESSVEGCEPHYRPDGKFCDWTYKEYLGKEKFEYYIEIAKESPLYDSGIVPFSENLAGDGNYKQVVDRWFNSKGHKECMLNIDWNYGAVAYYDGIWIAVFSFSDIK